VLFHDDQQGHIIIGEAVFNLAVSQQEISVESLIAELGVMAENGISEDKLSQIADARHWLKGFVNTAPRHRAELRWLATAKSPQLMNLPSEDNSKT